MNAMARPSAQTAAPIVIVDDGKAESVGNKRKLWPILLGVGLGALALGYLVGGVSTQNAEYNATVTEAGLIAEQVAETSKTLENINNALLMARERGEGEQFKLFDAKLTEDLEAIDLRRPAREVLFTSRLLGTDPQTAEETVLFYSDIVDLYGLVERHVRETQADNKVLEEGSDPLKKFGGSAAFGAVFDKPKDGSTPITAELVQIGPPVCEDGKPNPQGCPGAPMGFQYRPDLTSTAWGSKKFIPGEVSADQIFFVSPTTVLDTLVKGSERSYAEVAYMRRVKEIDELTKALAERRKIVEDRLNQKAQAGKRFSL